MASPRYPTRKSSALDEILEQEIEIKNMPRILEIQQRFKKDMAEFQHGLSTQDKDLEDYRDVLNKSIDDISAETATLESIKNEKQRTYQDLFKEFYDPTTMEGYDDKVGNVKDIENSYLEEVGLLVSQFEKSENDMFNQRLSNIINRENELRYDIQMIDERIRQIGDIEDIMLDTYSAGIDTSDSRTIEAQSITDYQGNVIESFPEETFHLHSIKDVKEAMNQSLKYYDEHIQTLNSKDISQWEWDSANDYTANFKNLQPWQKSAITRIMSGYKNFDEKNEAVLNRMYKEEQYRVLQMESGKTSRDTDYDNKVKAKERILNYLVNENPVYGDLLNRPTKDMTKWVLHQNDTQAQSSNPAEWDKINLELTEIIKNNPLVKAAGGVENFEAMWKRGETHPEVFIQQVWEPALRIFEGYAEIRGIIIDKVDKHNKRVIQNAKNKFHSSSKEGKRIRGKYKTWGDYARSDESGYIYDSPGAADDPNAISRKDMITSSIQAYLEQVSERNGDANPWTTQDMVFIHQFFLRSSPYSDKDTFNQPLFLNAQELTNVRESLGVRKDEIFYNAPGSWKAGEIDKKVVQPVLDIFKDLDLDDLLNDTKKRKKDTSEVRRKEKLKYDKENYDYYIGA